jgi:quinol-cytochrome oxidoreductase complex cytochrome b subunit
MAGLGAPELLILIFILSAMVLPIWGIIDAAVRPDAVWAATGQNKIVWVLVQIVLSTLGAVIYFAAIRPKLVAATTRPYS